MFPGGDDHCGLTCTQGRANKSAQLVKKKFVICIKLNNVRGLAVFSPWRLRRGRQRARNRSVRDTHILVNSLSVGISRLHGRKHYGVGLADSSSRYHFGTYRESCTCLADFTQPQPHSPQKAPLAAKSLQTSPTTPSSWLFRLFRRLPDIEIFII